MFLLLHYDPLFSLRSLNYKFYYQKNTKNYEKNSNNIEVQNVPLLKSINRLSLVIFNHFYLSGSPF